VIEESQLMATASDPGPDDSRIGGRDAQLALAGALLLVFLTLFIVGLA
jgi:hypothetical protein